MKLLYNISMYLSLTLRSAFLTATVNPYPKESTTSSPTGWAPLGYRPSMHHGPRPARRTRLCSGRSLSFTRQRRGHFSLSGVRGELDADRCLLPELDWRRRQGDPCPSSSEEEISG